MSGSFLTRQVCDVGPSERPITGISKQGERPARDINLGCGMYMTVLGGAPLAALGVAPLAALQIIKR